MEVGKINAQARQGVGSGSVRKLRQTGRIPAICYGAGEHPIPLAVDPADLQKALDPIKGRNTVLHMTIQGLSGGPVEVPVMLKDTQKDLLRGLVMHADFVRVNPDKPVRVTVPIVLTGKPEGVKAGGTLHQVYRTLTVQCAPDRIPAKIEIDVGALNIGQSIHVSDIKLPEGITAAVSAGTTLCVVTAPRAEKSAAEQAAEAAAAAAPAEGTAPEAGGEKKEDKGKAAPAAAPKGAAPKGK